MKSFLGRLFGKKPYSEPEQPPPSPRAVLETKRVEAFKKGDLIGGEYLVHGILGKGGLGVVYLTTNKNTQDVYAFKTFRDELLASAEARAAFKREALLWVNLGNHPNILAASFVLEISNRLFVATDFVPRDAQRRVNLADHLALANGPLDMASTLKWAVQFCLGMEHALSRGIGCHRDIKPANILITDDETLKICDFGLATVAEAAMQSGFASGAPLIIGDPAVGFGLSMMQTKGKGRCGTPGYMAPEVYRGDGADVRSDIYGFGLVLWQMASGSRIPPFATRFRGDLETLMRETYEAQMTGHLPRADDLLDPIIEKCLRPAPAERWGSFRELREALGPLFLRFAGNQPAVSDRPE